jgi:hypothetical protein
LTTGTSAAKHDTGRLAKSGKVSRITWLGELSAQKWMNFYTRVLAKFVTGNGLKLTVKVEVFQREGFCQQKLDETRSALRELGLSDKVDTE